MRDGPLRLAACAAAAALLARAAPVALFDYVPASPAPAGPEGRALGSRPLLPCAALRDCVIVALRPAIQERPPAELAVPLVGGPVFLSLEYAIRVHDATTFEYLDSIYAQLDDARNASGVLPIGYSTDQGGFAFLVFGEMGVTASIPYPGGFAKLAPCLPADANSTMYCHTLVNVSVADLSAMDVSEDNDVAIPDPNEVVTPISSGSYYGASNTPTSFPSSQQQQQQLLPYAPEDAGGDPLCKLGLLSSDGSACCSASCSTCVSASSSSCTASKSVCCASSIASLRSCNSYSAPCVMTVTQSVTVAYTAETLSVVGDMQAFIALAVADTNAGYIASGIPIRMVLAGSYQSSLSENVDSYALLMAFRGSDRMGANLAVLLSNEISACGRAFEDCSLYPSATCAYAVVNQACATGYYSFGHEIGHIQGADHNIQANPPQSRFPDNHGYIIQSGYYTSGGLRTIMSYAVLDELRVNVWSSPNVYYSGLPTGVVNQANNARVLTTTRYNVAAFNTPSEPGYVPTVATHAPSTSLSPSSFPTNKPTKTFKPSKQPSVFPTYEPSAYPTPWPTKRPSITSRPSLRPTSTSPTSRSPTSEAPTHRPSSRPTWHPTSTPTRLPSSSPSVNPTNYPTTYPTNRPSHRPSSSSPFSRSPTSATPTHRPSSKPTLRPTGSPSRVPTASPSAVPTPSPSANPTRRPSRRPSSSSPTSRSPTSSSPTSRSPTSSSPTSRSPTSSALPTSRPTLVPTRFPSGNPTSGPTSQPTAVPTYVPAGSPSSMPTWQPSSYPSFAPVPSSAAPIALQPSTSEPTIATPTTLRAPSSSPSVSLGLSDTLAPTSSSPISWSPSTTRSPTQSTAQPTRRTDSPTLQPSSLPTMMPSISLYYSSSPSAGEPSPGPASATPITSPTQSDVVVIASSSAAPTTGEPTSSAPSRKPTHKPTSRPSSLRPTSATRRPTALATFAPSNNPSIAVRPKTPPPVLVLFLSPTVSPTPNPSHSVGQHFATASSAAGSNSTSAVSPAAVSIPVLFITLGAFSGVFFLRRSPSSSAAAQASFQRVVRAIRRVPEGGAAGPAAPDTEQGAALTVRAAA